MQRPRDESSWTFTRHGSVLDFTRAARSDGAHSIQVGTQHLDVLIENRNSPVTVVVFHSALNANQPTVPVLQGHGMADRARINLVSVADPSIELGDVDLAWFLGNRALGNLRKHLSPVIRHAVESLGTERLILFGASGGGFAAVSFGADFPGSIVLAVNPRLDLSKRPHPRMNEYLRACHGATSSTPMLRIRRSFVTEQVADIIGDRLPFDLLLFQNLGDRIYLENQAQPFIERYARDPRLYVRFIDYADGHQPIPRELLDTIMASLAMQNDRSAAVSAAEFSPAFLSTQAEEKMILEADFDSRKLVAMRQEIVNDLVELAYWIQVDPVETGKYVGMSEIICEKVRALSEKGDIG